MSFAATVGDSEDDATALSLAWTDESSAALSLAAEAEADGYATGEGLAIGFTGTGTVADVPEDMLVTPWSSDLDGVLDTNPTAPAGVTAPPCAVWPLEEPRVFAPLQALDARRFLAGKPRRHPLAWRGGRRVAESTVDRAASPTDVIPVTECPTSTPPS